MSQLCFRVLSERYLTSEIEMVRWNPKYDLLSIATKRGDVILQRLFWKKAWQVSSKSGLIKARPSAVSVSSLSWSPNGKHLAVVYSSGRIIFVEIENGRAVYHIDGESCKDAVSKWVEFQDDADKKDRGTNESSFVVDDGDQLLLPLPPVEKSKASAATTSMGEPQSFISESQLGNHLSLFMVGNSNGQLRLYLNGFFHMADLNLRKFLVGGPDKENTTLAPVAFDLRPKLDRLALVVCNQREHSTGELSLVIFKTPLAFSSSEYWFRISKRVSHILTALRYIESIMQKISDSWEETIQDLDNKLTKYAFSKTNSPETIGDEFIQLLVYGIASPDLEHFLTHTLTDKGSKKLLASLENAHQNLFNMLGVNLDCAVSTLYHHVTTLKDMMADEEEEVWKECIETVAAFSLKITNVYDIAETHARSIGLFIRWLHRCVLTLSDENLPSSLSHFSDEQIDAVAKFIQDTFCKSITDNPVSDPELAGQFGLEKISLHLKEGYDKEEEPPFSNKVVIECRTSLGRLSLPSCVSEVRRCVKKIQDRLTVIFSRRFDLIGSPHSLYSTVSRIPAENLGRSFSLVHDAGKHCFRLLYAVEHEPNQLMITEFDDETAAISAIWKLSSPTATIRTVVNLDVYKTGIVAALVREREREETDWKTVLYKIDTANLQMPVPRTPSSPSKAATSSVYRNPADPITIPWNVMKNQTLNDGQFSLLSVSGSRKVGCVVFVCRTRVKLLEMEPDDDTTAEGSALTENQSSMDIETE